MLLSVSAAAFEAGIPEALTENAAMTDAAYLSEDHDLSLDKEVYEPSETITVSYINGTASGSKWVGIYVAGTALDSNQYKGFAYTNGSTGTLTLAAPSAPGTYEMRYFGDSSYGNCYDSVPFTVAFPEDTHYMTPDKQNYFPSETITVDYTNGTAQGTKWIGIYKADAAIDSDAYKAFAWTTAENGTLTVTAPAEYGDYELRFFGDNLYSLCFDRVPFSVVHHISLSKDTYYTAETLDVAFDIDFQHWFVVTDVGATVDGSNYNKYAFANTGVKGWSYIYTGSGVNTSVRAPRSAGNYEIHLLYNNGYDKVDSIPLTVIERCSLDSDTYTTDDTIIITYAGAKSGDWVGIYTPDDPDTNSGYSAWAYVNADGNTPTGTVTLPAPASEGSYELRVFAEHYACCVERHTFAVTEPSVTPPTTLDAVDYSHKLKGIRFKATVTRELDETAAEYGFIVTRALILNALDEELTFDLVYPDSLPTLSGQPAYSYGVAKNSTTSKLYDIDDAGNVTFAATTTGIPAGKESDVIVARPYAKYDVGGKTVIAYGVEKRASLDDVTEDQ